MKRSTLTAALFVVLFLPGCVMTNMEEGLNALNGKPITTAVSVLGYPDGQQAFGGDKVYIWSRNFQGSYTLPQTATTTGYIGNTPVYGTTTYNQTHTANYNCQIKLAVGPDDRIKHWEYQGNPGGCGGYARSLKAYADSQKK